ncbi:hypothetical protein TNCV_1165901 [Trichonephila clavipes]|uniref:Uncharacterized protein n=1 Tax=Trichonephila clavipes TaxID=2585209 RepID=A0A8X6VJV0_TRICX|nr:hypothetical protein TNCV_1165901 [Trichonephila clavipes]
MRFSFGENLELIFFPCVKEIHTDQVVSVFGMASLSGRMHRSPIFSRGNVDFSTYRDDILDAYARLSARTIGDVFILQDDDSRPHRDCIVDAYLEQGTIQLIQ